MAPGWVCVRITDPLLLRITRNVKQAVENGYSWQLDYTESCLAMRKHFTAANVHVSVMQC